MGQLLRGSWHLSARRTAHPRTLHPSLVLDRARDVRRDLVVQAPEGWCQTLFLVLTCRLRNHKQSLTPGTDTWHSVLPTLPDVEGCCQTSWRDVVRLCSWFLRAVFETKNKV